MKLKVIHAWNSVEFETAVNEFTNQRNRKIWSINFDTVVTPDSSVGLVAFINYEDYEAEENDGL